MPQGSLPTPRERACPRCGTIDIPVSGPGKGPHHASAHCGHCGAWLGWLSRYPPAERDARRQQARLEAMTQKPPSQAQLGYLRTLGDSGPPPTSMAEASQRIDARVREPR